MRLVTGIIKTCINIKCALWNSWIKEPTQLTLIDWSLTEVSCFLLQSSLQTAQVVTQKNSNSSTLIQLDSSISISKKFSSLCLMRCVQNLLFFHNCLVLKQKNKQWHVVPNAVLHTLQTFDIGTWWRARLNSVGMKFKLARQQKIFTLREIFKFQNFVDHHRRWFVEQCNGGSKTPNSSWYPDFTEYLPLLSNFQYRLSSPPRKFRGIFKINSTSKIKKFTFKAFSFHCQLELINSLTIVSCLSLDVTVLLPAFKYGIQASEKALIHLPSPTFHLIPLAKRSVLQMIDCQINEEFDPLRASII